MPFKYSLESQSHSRIQIGVKDISFPPSEVEALKKQTRIITHRVSDDAIRFEKDDLVYARQIDDNYCFKVESIQFISNIEKSPYLKELTTGQVTYLRKFDKIAVLTLSKTQYERPYDLKTIKSKYPPEIYERLRHDPVHWWRAVTGIDMIHLEPDDDEQRRTIGNWGKLTQKLQKISDAKSIEFFRMDNRTHVKFLIIDRIKKIFSRIVYGLRDPKTNKGWKITHKSTTADDYDLQWRLGTPAQTIESGYGNCYDTVNITYQSLARSSIKFKVFFMFCENGGFMDSPTHTFALWLNDYTHEWQWLEGSWDPFKNNDWHSSNINEIVKWIGTAMANAEQLDIVVNELQSYPPDGCDMKTFETMCRGGKKVLVVQPERK